MQTAGMDGSHPGGMMMPEGQNGMQGEPSADMARGEQGASTTQDYNQWVAKMQAFYKQPQTGTSNQAAAPYYSAQMGHHAYANLWGGQAQAAMMTPYAAPGPFYPTSVYPHAAMSTPQGAYPGYGVQPAQAGTAAASSDPNAYRAAPTDGKTADGQMGAGAEPKDEREAKRQRRKQSNRESARRSRLRKQAECEDLGSRVNNLTHENVQLRQEMNALTEKVNLLISENKNLRVQVKDLGGSPPPEPVLPASTLDTTKLLNLAETSKMPPASKSGDEDDGGDDSGSEDEEEGKDEKGEDKGKR
mmetsp:Transcript_39260/g.85407  ORF Transcript_39260/g.85407 Transcript_39260/m.85407 type:complete len:302 (-) Transcript_39260:850-1755(-)|eukprot:CAMPEP_0118926078 /NCGR_PEP_ID=MMETSP1169-20130426/3859_1 /TAXON_ID=36882 /ORGANISM="Pyramimonas obovata, Strain CCMP722" /LENGTH=301 /DNA_ID=CAMNT_0006867555 /DNA_START=310 /DNA_END=1215 /DNA_ORIENTATION=+